MDTIARTDKDEYTLQALKKEILDKVEEYGRLQAAARKDFREGDRVVYAGRVYDEEELKAVTDSALDFWLTEGAYAGKFEEALSRYLEVSYVSLVNSGSSANLLAFMALTSPQIEEKRRIVPGDEVITAAAAFPTTVAPIIQYGAVPVFVDIGIPSYNIDPDKLDSALTERTKAVMLAHTLGNPFALAEVRRFCDKYGLWLIEDNCDALGSEYKMEEKYHKTGTFGDIGTSSFYPAHHITTGEGGAVYTNNPLLHRVIRSLRDWGRDCRCPGGTDNYCGRRYEGSYGTLPPGYDHKYVYSHLGYNLKMTDMQAAIGWAQMGKLEGFVAARRRNWHMLREGLKEYQEVLLLPEETQKAKASWFGFLMTVSKKAGFTRDELARYLEEEHIQTRYLFSGNLTRHPCFAGYREGTDYRISGSLTNTDRVMEDSLWLGVYPGMGTLEAGYMLKKIKQFMSCR